MLANAIFDCFRRTQMAAGGMFSGPPAGGGGAAFDAAAGGSAAGASAARARGDGGAATNAAAGGEAGGGLMALLDHPDLADLKGKPLAEKILSDMQQYGSVSNRFFRIHDPLQIAKAALPRPYIFRPGRFILLS
jgi:hypothetical protein